MRRMSGFTSVLMAAVLAFAVTGPLAAQAGATATISGQVMNEDGQALTGANVVVTHQQTGAEFGARTGEDGRYRIADLRPGLYRVVARIIGYDAALAEGVRLTAGETRELDFTLGERAIALNAIEVFAARAVERETPVAYTNIEKEQIKQQLGSQDIPLVLNVAPSVYSTEVGGAAGDARINVRGFDQRNTSVMINGVPVNDMENGWVYWSNWDGVGDATSSIQLQRGLSAVNLATPSIGGTMNIVTDATAMSAGGMVRQEMGSDGFLKTTGMLATGLLGDRFALMAQGVRKTGDGLARGLYTDAWAYYVGASYRISNSNRLDLYAIGAPQRHGQRLYAQNIGAFSAEYARGLSDYDPAALAMYPQSSDGYRFNENFAPVSSSYTGMQAEGSSLRRRAYSNFMNERENFFHKPQINVNWYSSLSDAISLSTVAYYSGGAGGGTGTAGDFEWDYASQPTRIADWDRNITINQGTVDADGNAKPAGQSMGILRNSRNNQWTIGAISRLQWALSQPLTVEAGLDWRTAEIDHYREVRDLLGGDYFIDTSSDFWTATEQQRGLGDKMAYDFTNTVDWLGGHLQGAYRTPAFTLFGVAGLSTIKYTYTNHFVDDGTGNELYSQTDHIMGYQIKGGGLYNVSQQVALFGNAGYISRVPIFDGVIDDIGGVTNPDPKNETFLSFEAGIDFRSLDRALEVKLNGYYTRWNDRTLTRGVIAADGTDALISLLGLDAVHMGVEAEVGYRMASFFQIDLAGAFANWTYTDDVAGTYRPDARNATTQSFNFYVNDLKVGDAPQLQVMGALSVFPVEGLFAQIVGRTYGRHWAAFDPFDRTDSGDRTQSWQIPGYAVVDAHFSYTLPASLRLLQQITVFGHVFNLLDKAYISDAIDNSSFNGFDDDHDADDAEVHFGLRRRFNLGLQVNF